MTRFLSDQIFSFVVFFILARLLTQSDIGAFAVMAVTAEAFRIIATSGMVQTLARKNQDRKTPRLNPHHSCDTRIPSSASKKKNQHPDNKSETQHTPKRVTTTQN